MGLTIHYDLKFKGSDAAALKRIQALHQAAQDLPFKSVGQIVELSGDACNHEKRERSDPLTWLMTQAVKSVVIESRTGKPGYTSYADVKPTRLIAFDTDPGEGCESANFGLCQYPKTVETSAGPVAIRLSGWRWHSFCKTQYAGNPDCGGTANFLKCHLAVIALLDKAKTLKILERVSDEGEFWNTRDIKCLIGEEDSMNKMIAAFGGVLKDALGDEVGELQTAISKYPNVEKLEAEGQSKLSPELIKLLSTVGTKK